MSSPSTASPSPSTWRLALLAAGIGAAGCLWWAWCHYPGLAWNEIRLAPAFALRHGINPYPPVGGGPLSTWIYGPVGLLVNLPATFAPHVIGALQLASLVNFVLVLAPLAVVFFGSSELRARGLVASAYAFALGVLLVPAPNLVLQVADHSAIAFGLLSCWCLCRTAQLRPGTLVAAAMLSTLAIWSKQIAVFLGVAQFAYLLIAHGRRTALAYTAWSVALNLAAAGMAVTAFGFRELWLNLVSIPAQLPWADLSGRLAQRPLSLLAQIVLPTCGLILLWKLKRWPSGATASGRFFQLTSLVFFAMLPVGLIAYGKIGGDTNLLHSWSYLMPGALLVWLLGAGDSFPSRGQLLLVTVCALFLQWPRLLHLPARPQTRQLEIGGRLAASFPQGIWFPLNPLLTYYSDGHLWHSEDGIVTRELAGCGLQGPEFRQFLPPRLQAVAYPESVQNHATMSLLPEFTRRTDLPAWTLLTPPGPVQPHRE